MMLRVFKWGVALASSLLIGLAGGFVGLIAGLELSSLLLGLLFCGVGFTVGSYLALVGVTALLRLGMPRNITSQTTR